MATSNQYNFSPAIGEIVLYSYNLIGIRPTALLQEHFESARMATNMMLSRWSSQGVNLWTVDMETVPLVQGTATYAVPSDTIVMLDAYISTTTGSSTIDRIIMPVSRTEYASYPNKEQQGFPTTFWFDRTLSPTVTLWPVPDGSQTNLKYYRVRRIQDSNLQNAETVELPYYFLEALAFGLAQRLAMIWAPEKVAIMKPLADEAYQIAASQNVETANTYISPSLSSYWRV
ncbi:MAG: hypothetical protein ABFD60_15270 [Bryobacteraceae bacterium]